MELNKNRKQISLEKPKTVLLKIFNILFVAVFIYIVYVAIFHNYDAFCKMNPVINIIGASVLFAILYLANRLIKKMDSKKQNIICVVCLLIMLVLQFIFIKYLLFFVDLFFVLQNLLNYDKIKSELFKGGVKGRTGYDSRAYRGKLFFQQSHKTYIRRNEFGVEKEASFF